MGANVGGAFMTGHDHGPVICVLWLLPEAILQGQQIGCFLKGIKLFRQRQQGESEVGKQISE